MSHRRRRHRRRRNSLRSCARLVNDLDKINTLRGIKLNRMDHQRERGKLVVCYYQIYGIKIRSLY